MKATIKSGGFPYDPNKYPHNHIILGGDPSNPSWEEYLDNYSEKGRAWMHAIREAIIREDIIGATGEEFDNMYFEFDDENNTKISFSWRAHGDLMQAIVDKREGYMTYYMDQLR